MSYIENKYIGLLSSRLDKFVQKGKDAYNFRCFYCGDSKKTKNKARGYLYSIKDTFNYKCHNCGKSTSFSNFLKDIDPPLYDQYVIEKFKGNGKKGLKLEVKKKPIKPVFKKKYFNLPRLSELNKEHFARKYAEDRKIPEKKLNELYFCEKFKEWVNTQKPTFKSLDYDEPRIIIPLIYNNEIFGFQGRSLSKNSKLKYITIILDDSIPKIYGLDQIEKDKTVYITEGPFDSTFISNAIAMCGADADISKWGISNPVWIYDNEPRNKEIVSRISRTIERGDRVVIWPSNIKEKDINDMVLSGLNVQSVVESNSYSGLEAKLKFTTWKKI